VLLGTLIYVFVFGAVVVDGVLTVAEVLDPVIGLPAMAIGLFYGGVMHALAGTRRDVAAVRERARGRALTEGDAEPRLPARVPGRQRAEGWRLRP
jgi:hypothetical protein